MRVRPLQQRFRHFKVVLSKRLGRFKYDYREEWLRLIDNLSSTASPLSLRERAVMALAEIMGSPGGLLFVQEQDHGVYVPAASWGLEGAAAEAPWEEVPRDGLMSHMEANAWIVDAEEPLPVAGDALFVEKLTDRLGRGLFVVPLLLQDQLFGYVTLQKKQNGARLTYEDIDLLRTGGRQVASYLAQQYASQRLAEAQQFEAYGRMTAFLMHDLKNIVAQQSLLLHNAARHKHEPAFIDDAFETIGASVERMNRALKQLRSPTRRSKTRLTNLVEVLDDAVARCRVFSPAPELEVPEGDVTVLADADRLSFGITNLIRNAQQAASATGAVRVTLTAANGSALLEVADNGPGMSDSFVQSRLFRPFDSTSPEMGMGLGAFQLRETVRAIGGTVAVKTGKGLGARFQIRLPLSRAADSAGAA